MLMPFFMPASLVETVVAANPAGSSNIGDLTGVGGLAAVFDGTTAQDTTACARSPSDVSNGYVGKNWGASNDRLISKVECYPASDNGWHQSGNNITLTLYGKASAPANGTDGTVLGSTGPFADSTAMRTITASVLTTAYQYSWVYIEDDTGGSKKIACAELVFYELL